MTAIGRLALGALFAVAVGCTSPRNAPVEQGDADPSGQSDGTSNNGDTPARSADVRDHDAGPVPGKEDCGVRPDSGVCPCTPNTVRDCSDDDSGKAIGWPTGTPVGVCKYGTQTCTSAGTWGACTGAKAPAPETCNKLDDDCNGIVDDGPAPDAVPSDAVFFVYDGDGDSHARMPGGGYQPVHACASNAPTKAPDACTKGVFIACSLGTTADKCCPPNAWKMAGTIQADDCNDENPTINPVAPQQCDGVDHNCSGVTKPPACVCTPNQVDKQCSTLATGATIKWPTGAPVGSCLYGTRHCAADGKSWGPCEGAVGPAATDNCAKSNNDDNCNGVPNDSCQCVLPAKKVCGSMTGSCKQGMSSCQSDGTWGSCVGSTDPKPQDTCDPNNDDNCDGVANNGYPTNTSICQCLNGAQQACGNCGGGTQICSGGMWGNCIGAPSIGAKCNVDNINVGACLNGGTMTCDPNNKSTPHCVANSPLIHTSGLRDAVSPNGSWDWNCDGKIQMTNEPNVGNNIYWPNFPADCSGWMTSYQDTVCNLNHDANDCNTHTYSHTCGVSGAGPASPETFCNVGMSFWGCLWDGQDCYHREGSYFYVVEKCQ